MDAPVLPDPRHHISYYHGLCSLEIHDVKPSDAGVYVAKATNPRGSTTCSAPLEIDGEEGPQFPGAPSLGKPIFISHLENVVADTGDRIIFKGVVLCKPVPDSVVWLKDGIEILENEKYRMYSDDEGNVKLSVRDVKPNDVGLYTTIVKNNFGTTKSVANLKLRDVPETRPQPEQPHRHEGGDKKPVFVVLPAATVKAYEGEPLTLKCVAQGEPKPKVRWFRGVREMSQSPRHNITADKDGANTFQINSVMMQTDGGTYEIEATNIFGTTTATVMVVVEPRRENEDFDFEPQKEIPFDIAPQKPIEPIKPQEQDDSLENLINIITTSTDAPAPVPSDQPTVENAEESIPVVEEIEVPKTACALGRDGSPSVLKLVNEKESGIARQVEESEMKVPAPSTIEDMLADLKDVKPIEDEKVPEEVKQVEEQKPTEEIKDAVKPVEAIQEITKSVEEQLKEKSPQKTKEEPSKPTEEKQNDESNKSATTPEEPINVEEPVTKKEAPIANAEILNKKPNEVPEESKEVIKVEESVAKKEEPISNTEKPVDKVNEVPDKIDESIEQPIVKKEAPIENSEKPDDKLNDAAEKLDNVEEMVVKKEAPIENAEKPIDKINEVPAKPEEPKEQEELVLAKQEEPVLASKEPVDLDKPKADSPEKATKQPEVLEPIKATEDKSKQPVEEEEPVKVKPLEEIPKETVPEQPVSEATQEQEKEPAKELPKEPVNEPVEEAVKEQIKQPEKIPIDEPVKKEVAKVIKSEKTKSATTSESEAASESEESSSEEESSEEDEPKKPVAVKEAPKAPTEKVEEKPIDKVPETVVETPIEKVPEAKLDVEKPVSEPDSIQKSPVVLANTEPIEEKVTVKKTEVTEATENVQETEEVIEESTEESEVIKKKKKITKSSTEQVTNEVVTDETLEESTVDEVETVKNKKVKKTVNETDTTEQVEVVQQEATEQVVEAKKEKPTTTEAVIKETKQTTVTEETKTVVESEEEEEESDEETGSRPSFEVPVKSQIVQFGTTATFECVVAGDPEPTVEWLRGDKVLVTEGKIRVVKDGKKHRLHIDDVDFTFNDQYAVRATNKRGRSQYKAKLLVKGTAPSFAEPIKSVVVPVGTPAKFVCKLAGNPMPTAVWQKDGVELQPSDRYVIKSEGDNFSFEVSNPTLDDKGQYSIVASNNFGRSTFSATLVVHEVGEEIEVVTVSDETKKTVTETEAVKKETVLTNASEDKTTKTVTEKKEGATTEEESEGEEEDSDDEPGVAPGFEAPVKSQAVPIHTAATFECVVKGDPQPTVKWMKGDKVLTTVDRFKISSEGRKHTLVIDDVTFDDNGQYVAVASNKVGRCKCTATMLVKGIAPRFEEPLKSVVSPVGSNAAFDCKISGLPDPKITWTKDDAELKFSDRVQAHKVGNKHTLTFTPAEDSDNGQYTLVASNDFGRATFTATLVVHEVGAEVDIVVVKSGEQKATESASKTKAKKTAEKTSTESTTGEERIVEEKVTGSTTQSAQETVAVSRTEGETTTTTTKGGKKVVKSGGESSEASSSEEEEEESEDAKTEKSKKVTSKTTTIAESEKATTEVVTSENQQVTETATKTVTESTDAVEEIEFESRIRSQSVKIGSDARLECSVKGLKNSKIEWLKDDVIVAPNNRVTTGNDGSLCWLAITKVSPEEDGLYTLRITNSKGSKEQLASILVKEADAGDSSETVITKTTSMTSSSQPSESTESTETRSSSVTKTVTSQEGEESVTYSTTTTSSSGGISFASPMRSQSCKLGSSAKFDVIVNGATGSKIEWLKDDVDVVTNDRVTISNDGDNCCLSISSLSFEDDGLYTLRVSGATGKAEQSASLLIKGEGPSFSVPLKSVAVPTGSDATLECRVTGTPSPTISWQKAGVALTPSDRLAVSADGDLHRLVVKATNDSDNGMYTVVASNKYGTTSFSAQLLVHEPGMQISLNEDDGETSSSQSHTKTSTSSSTKVTSSSSSSSAGSSPTFTKSLQGQIVEISSTATFTCTLSECQPEPTVTWSKDGQILSKGGKFSITSTGCSHSLIIENVDKSEEGLYKFEASNDFGRLSCSASLVTKATASDSSSESDSSSDSDSD